MTHINDFVHCMFSLRISDINRITSMVMRLEPEPKPLRESTPEPGTKFPWRGKDCYLQPFLAKLEDLGFEMTAATCERCFDRQGPPYFKVRFHLARPDFARHITENFKKIRPALRVELYYILEDAGFSLEAHDNAYFQMGNKAAGCRSLSINTSAPEWLLEADGTPVLVWDRPKRQHGARKIPRKAAHILDIVNGDIQVVPALS